jgi:hypothetical protein
MAFPVIIQSGLTHESTSSSFSTFQTGLNGVTAGNSVALPIGLSSVGATISSITDNQGNSWSQVSGCYVYDSTADLVSDVWWTPSLASSGQLIITVTLSGTTLSADSAPVEMSNVSSAAAVGSNVNNISGSKSFHGPNINGSNQAIYLTQINGGYNSISVGSPWTIIEGGAGGYPTALAAMLGFHTQQAAFSTDVNFNGVATGVAFVTTAGGLTITGNAGVANATVSYSGGFGSSTVSGNVTADGSGNYTISALPPAVYTITPSLTGYVFSPVNRVETSSFPASIPNVNFTAAASYSVSGTISNGVTGIAGVTVTSTGAYAASTTTDSNGNYTLLLPNGTSTITPTKSGDTFSPASQNVTVSSAPITGVNFGLAGPAAVGWSPQDCRNYATFPNTGVNQASGATFYDQSNPTTCNTAGLPTDSRAAGAPVDSRAAGSPINSRNNPNP